MHEDVACLALQYGYMVCDVKVIISIYQSMLSSVQTASHQLDMAGCCLC